MKNCWLSDYFVLVALKIVISDRKEVKLKALKLVIVCWKSHIREFEVSNFSGGGGGEERACPRATLEGHAPKQHTLLV